MKKIKLFEQFLNEYNVAASGIVVMYNLTEEAIEALTALGAKVTKEAVQGKDSIYDVAFDNHEIGQKILNWLEEVDPLPMPDLRHLYPGLFENSQYINSMKNFDDFEKRIRINESELSFINEGETIELIYVMDDKGNPKNISVTDQEADAFLRGPLKGNGKKGYKTVLRKDYDDSKVNVSNIKNWKDVSESVNESTEAMKMVKTFPAPQHPKDPIKRELTEEENEAMRMHFPVYSWSNIDADGNIVLGGGTSDKGKFYITEEDLKKVMELPKINPVKK